MNRLLPLVRTHAVTLLRFDHPTGVPHRDPDREQAGTYTVNFVEHGAFRLRTTGAWQPVTREALFVTWPGLEFSCAHDEDCPTDRCLSVSYEGPAVESARASRVVLPTAPVRALTDRAAYLGRGLATCGPGDEARAEALAGALLSALANDDDRQPLFSPHRFTWHARRVDRAKAMIEANFAEPLSLSLLAQDAGLSVFHFARVFGALQGQPPHRYLLDIRLARARERLLDGARVTETQGLSSLQRITTMRRRIALGVVVGLVAAVPLVVRAQAPGVQITEFFKAYDAAFNARDIDKLATLYHRDVTIFEGTGVNRGWADYRDNHLGPELKMFQNLQWGHSNIVVHSLGASAAYVTADYAIKYRTGERDVDSGGIATHVLVKEDGQWKIRHSMTAARRRPAGGAVR